MDGICLVSPTVADVEKDGDLDIYALLLCICQCIGDNKRVEQWWYGTGMHTKCFQGPDRAGTSVLDTANPAMRKILLSLIVPVAVTAFSATDVPAMPLSMREALVKKSKEINPENYATPGWSNRAGTVLTPISLNPGVYTGDRPFYWNNIDVSCRMTVVELPTKTNGKPDLWVHSPVNLDGAMMETINKLGNVKFVMSPNYEHLKFAAAWYQNFPGASMWGCPGLMERKDDVKWDGEIADGFRPKGWKGGDGTFVSPDAGLWDTDILQPLHINIEKNPFTGRPFFNEVIFFHAPSKTLIATDLFWNYPGSVVPNKEFGRDDSWELAPVVDEIPLGSRAWKVGMDKVYAPFFNNFMVTDKSEYRDICNHILNVWDVETAIPAHGDILRGKELIRSVLKKSFGF